MSLLLIYRSESISYVPVVEKKHNDAKSCGKGYFWEKNFTFLGGKNEKSKTGAPVTPLCHCVGMPSVLHVRRGLK